MIADRTRQPWPEEGARRHAGQPDESGRGAAKGAPPTAAADAFAANVLPVVRQLQAAGTTTARDIARELNDRGVKTARGGAWFDSTVRAVLARRTSASEA